VLRSAESLARTEKTLAALRTDDAHPSTEDWELTNLQTVAATLVASAAVREETRGSHWREDFPDRDDARWHRHLRATLVDGAVDVRAGPELEAEGPA
jgi:succinate dehydrogenase/fumarate reductase flavoprotein subunit